jgi:RsiW-degrading membrane proteinase PrsW (M82 family)
MIANALAAFVPVVLFLVLLVMMDSFKLARPSTIAKAIGWGVAAALISDLAYGLLAPVVPVSPTAFSRYVAPIIEETTKALFIVYLILRRRIGFPVDAAQLGFAVGTGFALVENLQYLRVLGDAGFLLWCVRGLGTAMLHGATTAVFAMVAHTTSDRHPDRRVLVFLPGALSAVVIHSAFNHAVLPPIAMTALLLIGLPILVLVVFERSEVATRDWVGAGLDLDLVLLTMFSSEGFGHTRFGRYLRELRERFPGPVVTDMLCLLRVELELSVQAKAVVMAREAGIIVPFHPDTASALAEIRYLRASIGPTGLLALKPVHMTSHRDIWHRHLLIGPDGQSGWSRWLMRLFRRRSKI